MSGSFWVQTRRLLVKNVLVKRRMRRQTMFEMFFPVYMTGVLCLIYLAVTRTVYPENSVFPPVDPVGVGHPPFPGNILAAPDQSTTRAIMDAAIRDLEPFARPSKPKVIWFNDSDSALSSYGTDPDSCWALVFFSTQPSGDVDLKHLNYTIRLKENSDGLAPTQPSIPSTASLKSSSTNCHKGFFNGSCAASLYMESGFAAIQRAIDAAAFRLASNNATDLPAFFSPSVKLMPVHELVEDNSADIQPVAVMFLIMAFSPLIQYLMVNIVSEKEKGIKEAMHLMGLNPLAYWASWFITYAITTLIPAILMTAIVFVGGVLKHSNFILIALMLYLFGLSIVCMAFAFTPFFKAGRVAGVAGSLSTTIFSLIVYGLKPSTVSSGPAWLLSLLPPCAASLGLQRALELDSQGGFNFDNFATGAFSPLSAVIMFIVDAVIYTTIAYFLDLAMLGEGPFARDGILGKLISRQGNLASGMATVSDPPVLDGQRESAADEFGSESPALEIYNVSKQYAGAIRPALMNVTLRLRQGQIFALLGHNGAGKTTLHQIITGLLQPSEGRVSVHGQDLRSSKAREAMRAHMGVCPQHDILLDILTVQEHLRLYAGVKGIPPEEIESETRKLLAEIDLTEKADAFSKDLSGGQKRKLSVGIALIGDPRILCLDEPSSGMDPYSRRKLWKLLQRHRQGRVTLLTTHYMQEADVLADTKAVLSRGSIQCVGSSLFLKRTYGVGYSLTVDQLPQADSPAIIELVKSNRPSIADPTVSGSELTFSVPTTLSSHMSDILKALDDNRKKLGINTFGVAMTSLEEVFLRLQEQELLEEAKEEEDKAVADLESHEDDSNVTERSMLMPSSEYGSVNSDVDAETAGVQGHDGKAAMFWKKVAIMMRVRALQLRRTPAVFFFMIFMPLVLMTVSLTVFHSSSTSNKDETAIELAATTYGADDTGFVFETLARVTNNTPQIENLLNAFENVYAFRRVNGSVTTTQDALDGKNGLLFTNQSNYMAALDIPGLDSLTLFVNGTARHAIPMYLSQIHSAAMGMGYGGNVTTTAQPLPYSPEGVWDPNAFYAVLLIGMAISAIPGGFAIDVVRDRTKKMKHQVLMGGVGSLAYWLSFLFVDMILFSIPVIYAIVLAQILKVEALMGYGLAFYGIGAAIYLPLGIFFNFIVSFMFQDVEVVQSSWPPLQNFIAFIPYIIVATIDGTGHHSISMALHYVFAVIDPPYTFLSVLYFVYLDNITSQVKAAAGIPSSFSDFSGDARLTNTIGIMVAQLVLLASSLVIIEYRKALGGLFSRKRQGSYSFDSSTATYQGVDSDVIEEMRRSEQPSSQAEIRVSHVRKTYAAKRNASDQSGACSALACCTSSAEAGSSVPASIDLKTEAARYQRDGSTFVAVSDVSFNVEPGTIFGLLGPNGAGKTTTLRIMTGEETPTSGDSYVSQHSMRTQLHKAFENMGFCPQFSALWENLTTKEHLDVFARLRPEVHGNSYPRAVERVMQLLGIAEYRNVRAKQLSGGTQRKLSVAIALINDPRVVLLDEPSTGMDPGSRRKLWDVIQATMQHRAAILTTHSMEEAEALCNRIGIMVCGSLKCVGSPHHLKSKYGEGYVLEVQMAADKVASMTEWLQQQFDDVEETEVYGGHASYALTLTDSKLPQAFQLMEENRQQFGIEEYAISQSTLEQVFLRFAKMQEITEQEE